MNKGQIVLTLTLSLLTAGVAWAQGDQNPPPSSTPVPAFGQENPAPPVSENPPISAIDQPGLEPHAAPESFLLPGLHVSESVDSNVGNNLGGSSIGAIERGLGSLTLQKLWKSYALAADYIGGVSYYNEQGIGLQQLEQFDFDSRIYWKRGQLAMRDSFSYLPEGTFGFSSYGGGGAYNAGLGSMGSGMLGAGAFGGGSAFNGANGVSLGQVPRITDIALVDVVESLTPKSSVTLAVGYGVIHFNGQPAPISGVQQNISFIGSHEESVQVAYDRILNPKDQIALSYGYQGFSFTEAGTSFHTNVLQVMYGHRISGRLNLTIGAGPQFTHISDSPVVCEFLGAPLQVPISQCVADGGTPVVLSEGANHIGLAGSITFQYRFPKTLLSAGYQRFNTNGGGVFAGSLSDIVHVDARRPLSRVWDAFTDLGFSKNSQLQLAGSTVNASKFTYSYAGVGLHRQFSQSLRGFISYQFNYLTFNQPCPVPSITGSTVACSSVSQRHVGSIGVDWNPRPIRLD